MWVLSCESESLGGRRTWLRPGSECFIGRTSGKGTDESLHLYVDDKSVSRTHAIIKVDAVAAGDASNLGKRLRVHVEDRSKTGTFIDGDKLSKDTRTLDPADYTIRVGHYQPAFHLKWQPVVLSITNLSKSAKKSSDPLATYRARVEQAGVKLTTDYVSNVTTHVVAKKRNTAVGLQALIQARWLVTDSFVDALAGACDRRSGVDADGRPLQSRLEADFDASWPAEDAYIVPVGEEPLKRPNEFLRPRPERAAIFEKLTFVFLSQAQYDQLLPVVTTGGGKAFLFQYVPDETTVAAVVAYVAELAGSKQRRGYQLSQQPSSGGIVVIRIGDASLGRSVTFMRDLDIALDQRSIEQSEFFGAIVENNAASLRQPLRDASENGDGSPIEASQQAPAQATAVPGSRAADAAIPDSEPDDAVAPPKKRQRRIVTQSRFKGFDDFDPSQLARDASLSPEPTSQAKGRLSNLYEADEAADDAGDAASQAVNSKKRRAPDTQAHDDDQAMLDELLPGLKRRRTEALKGANKDAKAETQPNTLARAIEASATQKPIKSFLDKDIKAEIKKRREKEEEERRKDEEALQNALDVDISELKNLAKVETFQLPVRSAHAGRTADGHGENWDPAWNGRKNFKKFRPKGARASQTDGRAQPKVLVRLEEVSAREGAASDEYFLQPSTSARSRSQSQAAFTNDTAPASTTHDTDDSLAFQRRQRLRSQDRDVEDPEPSDPGTVDHSGPTSSTSQTLRSTGSRETGSKRAAAQPPAGGPAAKKSRVESTRSYAGASDDEDPLAFRRKRR